MRSPSELDRIAFRVDAGVYDSAEVIAATAERIEKEVLMAPGSIRCRQCEQIIPAHQVAVGTKLCRRCFDLLHIDEEAASRMMAKRFKELAKVKPKEKKPRAPRKCKPRNTETHFVCGRCGRALPRTQMKPGIKRCMECAAIWAPFEPEPLIECEWCHEEKRPADFLIKRGKDYPLSLSKQCKKCLGSTKRSSRDTYDTGEKTCSRCKKSKPITDFNLHRRDHRQPYCRECAAEQLREWKARRAAGGGR